MEQNLLSLHTHIYSMELLKQKIFPLYGFMTFIQINDRLSEFQENFYILHVSVTVLSVERTSSLAKGISNHLFRFISTSMTRPNTSKYVGALSIV